MKTVNPAKPKDDSRPLNKPNKVPSPLLSKDMKIIPDAAIIMFLLKLLNEFFLLKKYK